MRVTISAVIPTHDRSALVPRALRSVLAQTRPPDEVIVVDDGSSDDTARRVAEDFPGVQYVFQPHRGVSAARNRGVAEARGEWIGFLDSDDEWRPRKLEAQIEGLAAQPGHAICHTDEVWIRRGRRVNPGKRHEKAGGRIFQRCLPLCAVSPSSVLVRRSLLVDVGGFDEDLPVCEDYDLWLRVFCAHPALYLAEPLVVKHGGHDDQLSRRYPAMDRFRIRALGKILASDRLSVDDRAAAVETLLQKIAVFVHGARKRGRWEDVREFESLRARYGSLAVRVPLGGA